MSIIAINGPAGSGKNTLAEALQSRSGAWEEKAFATALKQILATITGEPIETFVSDKTKFLSKWGMTAREMLQFVGTEVMREGFRNDIWVKALLDSYDPEVHNWIITDLRFPNEHEALRKLGAKFVKIVPGSWHQPIAGRHRSEESLGDGYQWDYIFFNESMEQFRAACIDIYNLL